MWCPLNSNVFALASCILGYLEQRYSPRCRTLYALISLLMYVTMKIAVALRSGAVVFQAILGLDMYASSAVLICMTGDLVRHESYDCTGWLPWSVRGSLSHVQINTYFAYGRAISGKDLAWEA